MATATDNYVVKLVRERERLAIQKRRERDSAELRRRLGLAPKHPTYDDECEEEG